MNKSPKQELTEIILDSGISLIQVQFDDAEAIFNIVNSERNYLEDWLPFTAYTHKISDTKDYILSLVNAPAMLFEYVYTIRVNNNIVGMIGFVHTDVHNRKTEIGYWISQKFQQRGIVTKAVRALCKFAFEELNMFRIQIKCAVGNFRSSNIPKRLHFRYEGTERSGELFSNGSFKDLEIYSLLKSDLQT